MIKLKTLNWSNVFSYGADNILELDKEPLVQIIGKNGHGKTSIALIIEEILYNKNSKGIKKADILNRYLGAKEYSIGLTFEKDADLYEVYSVRSTTQTLSLFKNGEDISEHTPTNTYKLLEDIIGKDHKLFTQSIYQSSVNSLEFLTATDTKRKTFLIELFNLEKYSKLGELFKAINKEAEQELATISGKISTINSWMEKNLKEDLTEKTAVEIPKPAEAELVEQRLLSDKLLNISTLNKSISQNNTYKKVLESLVVEQVEKPDTDSGAFIQRKGSLRTTIDNAKALVKKIGHLNGTCPTCLQEVDKSKLDELIDIANTEAALATQEIEALDSKIKNLDTAWTKYRESLRTQDEWEKYYKLHNETLQQAPYDYAELQSKIDALSVVIKKTSTAISTAQDFNNKVSAHNSKVKVIREQLDSMRKESIELSSKLDILKIKVSRLQVLIKTFSTSGLVAYKIECLVKDLEDLINEYLVDLSDGRFQLGFEINSTDKLNVVITDNGKTVEINALSGGEKGRVNIATLLAIRKLMESLSDSKINLLFLDETVDSLDADGKEKLVEVLLSEQYLNTFIVSHGFTHPLLSQVRVVKENNISRIE